MRTILAIAIFLAGCSSVPVKWPNGCLPSVNGKISCKCDKLEYVRENHPTKPSPAFKQLISCDGEKLPIEAYSEK